MGRPEHHTTIYSPSALRSGGDTFYSTDMKLLIVLSCLLVAASAGYVSGYGYAGPYHLPVIGPNGVPLDEPAVAAAKAYHAAAHADAAVRSGHLGYVGAAPLAYAAPYGHYFGPQHIPVIGPNGVPLDEPAVAAARANHAAAHVEAKVRNGDVAAVVAHAPVAYAAGHFVGAAVPADTPEVAAAKAAHFAAHLEAKARNGVLHPLVHYRKRRGLLHAYGAPVAYGAHYAGPQHLPVIGPNGVPLDEPAVAAARAAHAAAHVEAKARNGDVALVAGPLAYAAPVAHYAGPIHLPVIGPNGVPVDEPAVAAARAAHAHAHVEASVRNGDVHGAVPLAHAW